MTAAPSAVARAKKAPADHKGSEPVFDLEAAAKAAEVEANGDPFPFQLRGEVFAVPPAAEWPIDVPSRLKDGDLAGAMESMLNGNYERFIGQRPTMGELNALFDAISEWAGVENLGN